ncbi:MAG TPA: hypothetical protein VF677_08390 [Flavobacterium sp.]|jgi:hypothetical protein
MRVNILITIIIIIIGISASAQSYKALNNVKMRKGFTLIRTTKVKNCSQPINTGSNIKKVTTFKNTSTNNEENYTVTEEKTAVAGETISVDKPIAIKIQSFDGKANIFIDETDKSKIHINYWLNGKYVVKGGVKLRIIERKLKCDIESLQDDKIYSETPSIITLTNDTEYDLWKCSICEIAKNPDYYKHSNKVIEVYEKDGTTIDYYLVNKYDREADYIVQLDNRQLIHFKETGFEFGPITIPIKIRPGFTRNNVSVEQEFTGDLNIGAFGGYKIGTYRARYIRGGGFTQLPTSSSCTIGGFLSFSATGLEKTNTAAGDNPIEDDSKKSIGIVSPGIGIMYSIYNFQIGIFGGFDLGIGSNAINWNHNNKPWMGFGFAYNLSNFWKK